jgi:pilus assembly protein CpaF
MSELNLIKEFLEDALVTDLLIDGQISMSVERQGKLEIVANPFSNEIDATNWVRNLLRTYGSRLDIAKPISEISLHSEYGLLRIHAVLGGECSKRTQISIRRHLASSLTLQDLVERAVVAKQHLETLSHIIKSKENFVIIGGTGSGKTTLLRAILGEVSQERVITIEDAAELTLGGRSVELTTREGNHEGIGEITLGQLVREALRMRPDRLVVGEARGDELLVLLQAMNTGHNGSGFTLHANSIEDTWPRMLAILVGTGATAEFSRLLATSSLSWVIHIQRLNGIRAVTAIERFVTPNG